MHTITYKPTKFARATSGTSEHLLATNKAGNRRIVFDNDCDQDNQWDFIEGSSNIYYLVSRDPNNTTLDNLFAVDKDVSGAWKIRGAHGVYLRVRGWRGPGVYGATEIKLTSPTNPENNCVLVGVQCDPETTIEDELEGLEFYYRNWVHGEGYIVRFDRLEEDGQWFTEDSHPAFSDAVNYYDEPCESMIPDELYADVRAYNEDWDWESVAKPL